MDIIIDAAAREYILRKSRDRAITVKAVARSGVS